MTSAAASSRVKDIAALRSRLDAAGVTFAASKSGRAALFCRDTAQNTLEFAEVI
jgi:hypothetical protein